MRRLTVVLTYFVLILSVGLGSAAHAAEMGIEVPPALEGTHSGHDRDQVPADADKGYPHHHMSCHADHIGVPVARTAMPYADVACPSIATGLRRYPAQAATGPDIRPPIA